MSFLVFLAGFLFRHFPNLETKLRDAAFETCTHRSSLLHPQLLPFLLPKFSFKHMFLQPSFSLPNMGLCVMAVIAVSAFSPIPAPWEWKLWWSQGSSNTPKGSHTSPGVHAASNVCKSIQMAGGSRHRNRFSIFLVPPTMIWLSSGWILFM